MEPIARRPFAQVERAQVQERYASAAERDPDAFFRSYAADPRSFAGRYVAADLFKEQFADYRASRDNRYLFNTPLHNTAAVLASEWLRRVIEDPGDPSRHQLVLLTGIPGAGKTAFVNQADRFPADTLAVYEGQLARPEPALPKIAQALDRGLVVTIAAVQARPEVALRNTLTRFNDIGRGASIGVMADIQAGLPAGLARIHAEFGDRTALRILDRSGTIEQQYQGWQHLAILKTGSDRDQTYAQLSNALECFREQGALSEAAYAQARGDEPRRDHRHLVREWPGRVATDTNRRELSDVQTPSADLKGAARAFLAADTPQRRREAAAQFPRLKTAFAHDAIAQAFARERLAGQPTQAQFVARFRKHVADALQNGQPLPDINTRDPERER